MSKNKNQKNYNKAVMQSGLKSNEYLNETLKNLNTYTNNYGDRIDYWTNKLNTKQLDLLSDQYLSENAKMLRNMGAFGTTSESNRYINNNAYSQQNYLASVLNKNIETANTLGNTEIQNLLSNAQINMQNRSQGSTAAANLDKLSNSWLNVLGTTAQTAGSVLQAIPTGWTQAAGTVLKGAGSAINNYYESSTGSSLDSTGLSNSTMNTLGNWRDMYQAGAKTQQEQNQAETNRLTTGLFSSSNPFQATVNRAYSN